MAAIPREARDGLMRVWLEILRERHPGTSWIAEETPREDDQPTKPQKHETAELSSAA